MPNFKIGKRNIGPAFKPFVIAEIGINHEGSMEKAKQMIREAAQSGAECVKFQSHVIEDEMSKEAKKVIPGNATVSIWDIMSRCAFSEEQERELKKYTESFGMLYLSTPFSRKAADRLKRMNVLAYKIGSGECNNYPLIEHVAKFKKPMIVSTGMNDIRSIKRTVEIIERHKVPYALLHCTSMYPTPYEKVRLGALKELQKKFPKAVIGLSDHSLGNYTCFGAVALGASILEKHFTSNKKWKGPDVPISITPSELKDLIEGSEVIQKASGGEKIILREESPTIAFAYATVVSIRPIKKGKTISFEDVWVKRPGTGEIHAKDFEKVIGRKTRRDILSDEHISWSDII